MPRATRSSSKTTTKQDDPPKKAPRSRTPVQEPQDEPKTSKKVKKTTSDLSAKSEKQEVKKEMKKIQMTGSVPVDPHFTRASQGKVVERNGTTYASTLNQSNIANNNNKFYIMQIIETQPVGYSFFCRWGRVGVVGQTSEMNTTDLNIAIRAYEQKLREKTKSGSYRIVEMNYDEDDDNNKEEEDQKKGKKKEEPETESQLPDAVQNLIRLIFDMKMMNNQMKEIGYDAKKMPLGKLSKSSIEKGYEALQKLADEVKGMRREVKLQEYSNDFYSYIPHDFGFIKMQNFILNTERKIKEKLQMLQSLQDIQIYTKILSEGKIASDINEVDSNYLRLKTTVQPINKKSELFRKLSDYVRNTHASTHNNYTLQIEEIFRLNKQEENQRYTDEIDNKQLLWHGSRLTNYVGILSQGLRIAPPEAPVTGYMFGKGVYFADMVSKSANYCCTSKANNTGLMLLCEVALGNMNEKFAADYYASNLPPGKQSTKGVGRTAPSGGEYIEGAWAPNRHGVPTGVASTSLLYNEFIVYDVAQIKSKFLFRMKFHYR